MLLILLFGLVASALAVNIPQPKLTHLSTGDIQLSLDDIPGAEQLDVAYSFGESNHQGKFHQNTDSRWYHRNHEAKYNGKDKIKYRIMVALDGKTIETNGKLTPGETGVAVLPPQKVRRGTVVFRDDFNGAFDPAGWNYEVSMYGGYNWEVQAYVPDARNIFTRNGHLFIKPTLTTDHPNYNDGNLNSATMDLTALYGYCTNADRYGCIREGRNGILPPVMSGKIKSKKTIRFGKVEARCRIPRGDWIWPAIWMLPRDSVYGGWPRSGEIDMMESRGNTVARDGSGHNHGVNEVGHLHWDQMPVIIDSVRRTGDLDGDWSHAMHTYRLDWTIDHIQVFVDNRHIMNIPQSRKVFGSLEDLVDPIFGAVEPKAAPFDKQFYLILNVAIAGTNGFFPDNWTYDQQKPWFSNSPTELQDFWNARFQWLQTWHGDDVAMECDYVEMTQY
uniref:Beta-1,3-glucanase n=1 Tax=Spisula sachalinensis TaxID=81899 RepID=Q7Z0T2_SPISA|nr:beta-1,3-glucanase [Pseudocardium sachalinense]